MTGLNQQIEKLTRLLSVMEDQVLSHRELSDLTMRQLNYLDIIRSFEEPNVSDLVNHLNVAKSTVTMALKDLMVKGFVRKKQSVDDRRVVFIELTGKGKKINDIHDKAHEKIVDEIFNCLDEKEIKRFQKLLKKLLEHSAVVNVHSKNNSAISRSR